MRSLTLLLPLLLVGCTTARGRAIEAAAAAEARGDRIAAAQAWAEACRLEPEDCARAADAREAAVAEAVEVAAPACGADEIGRCTAALRQVRDLAPGDVRVLALLAAAARRQLESCGDGLPGLRCAERWRDAIALPAYDEALAERRAALAAWFEAQRTGDPGADVQRLGAAACLAGDEVRRKAAAAAASTWDEAIARPFSVSWGIAGTAPLGCAELIGARPLRCGGGGMVMEFTGTLGRIEHVRHRSRTQVEWIAGTRRIPNPVYEPAALRVELAASALRAIETELAYASSDCDAAERAHRGAGLCFDCAENAWRDRACDLESRLERIERERRAALREAESDLRSTPAHLEEPIHRRSQLERTDHTWLAPWEASVRLGDAQQAVAGTAVHTDGVHAGHGPAGIAPDPLDPPPADFGAAELLAAVRPAALALVDEALLALASERAQDCPLAGGMDDQSLRCRAEVLRFSGLPADGSELLAALAGGPITCRAAARGDARASAP